MSIQDTVNRVYTKWMEGQGPNSDVVISSRVRLARNLADVPFPHMQSPEVGNEVLNQVKQALLAPQVREKLGDFSFAALAELEPLDRQILVEKHLISPLHAKGEGPRRGLALNEEESVSIMVNEEDHLRIQVLLPGFQLEEAWRLGSQVDDVLDARLNYAFDEKYGYLTCCPTNVGSGLRASVMMHLPALALTKRVSEVFTYLSKLGFVVRGFFGEGTEAKGNLFQISNQITLGPREEEIIGNLSAVSKQIIEQEELGRQEILKEGLAQVEDLVFRSYGILSNAYIISSDEAMAHLSNLRLGLELGLIKGIDQQRLNELLVRIRPAFLQKETGQEMDAFQRDLKRAEIIRKALS